MSMTVFSGRSSACMCVCLSVCKAQRHTCSTAYIHPPLKCFYLLHTPLFLSQASLTMQRCDFCPDEAKTVYQERAPFETSRHMCWCRLAQAPENALVPRKETPRDLGHSWRWGWNIMKCIFLWFSVLQVKYYRTIRHILGLWRVCKQTVTTPGLGSSLLLGSWAPSCTSIEVFASHWSH